ncbi:MAG: family 43 glycosylhydrolase [Lachnospiraceae bacterium]|nr:family 43 glycosylhydrolase [Lachnospiraceae bacterium]
MIENPILRGFCPDPSIINANGMYYIAVSTFEWWPGVKIFESSDLKNYKQIRSPLRRYSQLDLTGDPPSGGVWAPCLSYDGKRFYLVYTDVKTKKGRFYNTNNYVVWTDDIYKDWSDPLYLNSMGFDPSLFHDIDGKKYLVNMINGFKGITVRELDPENLKPLGDYVKVYSGSGIGFLEGPHLYHIGDYYYLIAAEGGTGYDHCVTMARSDNVYGPYETCPGNPFLTSDISGALQKCGHADIVRADNGFYYLVHLCARRTEGAKGCILGRETAIQEIFLGEDGFFFPANKDGYCLSRINEPKGLKEYTESDPQDFCDNFTDKTINVRYSSLRRRYDEFAHIENNMLMLRGQESLNSLHSVSLLAVRQKEHACSAVTKMYFNPIVQEEFAGLTYIYDNLNFYIFGKTADGDGNSVLTILKSDRGEITDLINPIKVSLEAPIELKIETDGTDIYFEYRENEKWICIDVKGSTQILTDEYCRGFTGAHFGMYVHDMLEKKACAGFEFFEINHRFSR